MVLLLLYTPLKKNSLSDNYLIDPDRAGVATILLTP